MLLTWRFHGLLNSEMLRFLPLLNWRWEMSVDSRGERLTALDLFIPLLCFIQHECPNSHSRQRCLVYIVERLAFCGKHIRFFPVSTHSRHPIPSCLLICFLPELPCPKEGENLVNMTRLLTMALPSLPEGLMLPTDLQGQGDRHANPSQKLHFES